MASVKNGKATLIQRRALRIDQNLEHPLYIFTLTSDELLKVAEISRITRDEDGKLLGYQRPDVRQHVQNIVDYLDSDSVIFPNSIILALSTSVKFKQSRGPGTDDGYAKSGTLEIQLPTGDGPKPAWIVDGQQRALALTKCKRRDIPIPVNAFVATNAVSGSSSKSAAPTQLPITPSSPHRTCSSRNQSPTRLSRWSAAMSRAAVATSPPIRSYSCAVSA